MHTNRFTLRSLLHLKYSVGEILELSEVPKVRIYYHYVCYLSSYCSVPFQYQVLCKFMRCKCFRKGSGVEEDGSSEIDEDVVERKVFNYDNSTSMMDALFGRGSMARRYVSHFQQRYYLFCYLSCLAPFHHMKPQLLMCRP